MPSSLRMYLSAKVKPVSLRSTMRTLPNAPLPTTRRSLKWLRLTAQEAGVSRRRTGGKNDQDMVQERGRLDERRTRVTNNNTRATSR